MGTTVGAKFQISATDETQLAFASVQRSLKSLEENVSGFKELAIGVGVGELIGHVVEEAAASEKSFAILQSQVKATGGAAGYTAEQLREMAEQLQATSTFSHTEIEQAEGQLLAFTTITGKNYANLIKVSMDFATVTGRDLPEAVKTLGEAVADPVTSLGRLKMAGVELTAAQKEQIQTMAKNGQLYQAQALLIKDIEHSYGGAADAARNTFGGALTALKNQFNDLLEGGKGSFDSATKSINELTATLNDPQVKQGFANIISGLSTLVSWLAQAVSALANFGQMLGEDLAEAVAGADDPIGQINEKMQSVSVTINSLQDQIKRAKEEGTNEGVLGKLVAPDVAKLQKQLDEAQKQMQQLQQLKNNLEKLKPSTTPQGPDLTPHVPKQAQVSPIDSKKADEARDSVNKMIESLQKETATFGENKEAVMRYEVAHGELAEKLKLMGSQGQKATQELIALAAKEDQLKKSAEDAQKALQEQNDRLDRAKQLIEALHPEKKLQDTEQSMQDLVGTTVDGVTVTKEMVHQYALLADKGKKTSDDLSSFGQEAAKNIQDSFAQFLFSPFQDGLRGMAESFVKTLEKMIDNIIAAQLMNKLFGQLDGSGQGNGQSGFASAISNGLSSYFGGGHADGGPVDNSQFYLVGEQGPELFAPSSSGTIIPNNALGNLGQGQSKGHTVNIDARGAGPDEVGKLLAMRNDIINSLRGDVEYRLNRGSWMSGRR